MRAYVLAALLLASLANPACATSPCPPAIAAAERQMRLPPKLLGAIAMVESGRRDPVSGVIAPWPWALNVEGAPFFYASATEAIAAVRAFRAQGVRSIDVGCMQINLQQHPAAFASLDDAFDPAMNSLYGARFLGALYRQLGRWPQAIAAYHSQTPGIGEPYALRVLAAIPNAASLGEPGFASPLPPTGDLSRYTPEFSASLRAAASDRATLYRIDAGSKSGQHGSPSRETARSRSSLPQLDAGLVRTSRLSELGSR